MAATPDLGAYFERVGFDGATAPTLATLERLHALHPAAFRSRTCRPSSGRKSRSTSNRSSASSCLGGRGGWCFEQNLLFASVLRALGFRLTTLAARVRWNAPPGELRPRSHMLLHVHLAEGDYIADVGFGGLVLTAPLRLRADVAQETPNETFRLRESPPGTYLLEANVAGEWMALYAFDLHEQLVPDYEVSNWYLANHPKSPFVTGVIAARSQPGVRHALRMGRYALHRRGGETETRALDDRSRLPRRPRRTHRHPASGFAAARPAPGAPHRSECASIASPPSRRSPRCAPERSAARTTRAPCWTGRCARAPERLPRRSTASACSREPAKPTRAATRASPGQASRPPHPVKDSINTRDLPTTNGTRGLADFRPREERAVLEPLLGEGAIVMGKTNLHELSRGWTCNNGAFGAVLNPYDPETHSGRKQRRIGRGRGRPHGAARRSGRTPWARSASRRPSAA
jgi:N-hydroxyarylamine O-acetyltransferase